MQHSLLIEGVLRIVHNKHSLVEFLEEFVHLVADVGSAVAVVAVQRVEEIVEHPSVL